MAIYISRGPVPWPWNKRDSASEDILLTSQFRPKAYCIPLCSCESLRGKDPQRKRKLCKASMQPKSQGTSTHKFKIQNYVYIDTHWRKKSFSFSVGYEKSLKGESQQHLQKMNTLCMHSTAFFQEEALCKGPHSEKTYQCLVILVPNIS